MTDKPTCKHENGTAYFYSNGKLVVSCKVTPERYAVLRDRWLSCEA